MLTITTPHDTVVACPILTDRPWQGGPTAAKAKAAEARDRGLFAYLIPLTCGYNCVGLANSQAEANRRAAAARLRHRAARAKAAAAVEGFVGERLRAAGVVA